MAGTWKACAWVALALVGCGGSDGGDARTVATGGAPATGGLTAASGGSQEAGGAPVATGGAGGIQSASGGSSTASGGASTGGARATGGGAMATGGIPTGGFPGTGGSLATGGVSPASGGQTGGTGNALTSLWSGTNSDPKIFFTTYPWNGPTPLMRATFSLQLDSCDVRFQSAWRAPSWTGSEDMTVSAAEAACLQNHANCANAVKLTFSGCDTANCQSQRAAGSVNFYRPACSSQALGNAKSVTVLRRTVTAASVTPSDSYETLASTEKWELLGEASP